MSGNPEGIVEEQVVCTGTNGGNRESQISVFLCCLLFKFWASAIPLSFVSFVTFCKMLPGESVATGETAGVAAHRDRRADETGPGRCRRARASRGHLWHRHFGLPRQDAVFQLSTDSRARAWCRSRCRGRRCHQCSTGRPLLDRTIYQLPEMFIMPPGPHQLLREPSHARRSLRRRTAP